MTLTTYLLIAYIIGVIVGYATKTINDKLDWEGGED